MTAGSLGNELADLGSDALELLEATHRAREEALARCRETIRACGLAIRAVHRLEPEVSADRLSEAEVSLRRAQEALKPFPALAAAGFLHDAEKEFAEARLTVALVNGERLAGFKEMAIGLAAWLNGLAEAASELRRHLLDRLRAGEMARGEELLAAMEEVYDLLVSVEYPDAITGGLRRATDALRGVVERSRADVTSTVFFVKLKATTEKAFRRTEA